MWALPSWLPRWAAVLSVPPALLALYEIAALVRRRWALRYLPTAPGGWPVVGHALSLAANTPWDLMAAWYAAAGGPVRFEVFGRQLVVLAEPDHLRSVWHTNQKSFVKDKGFTYGPFLPLLGTGLVTSEGYLWRKQRALVAHVFRIEILDEIVGMAKRAADRLCDRLEQHRVAGEPIDLEKEYRQLTLQVIGEALLSLAPEESDRVFPELYLPIMEEANRRVLRPWRMYLPGPAFFRFRRQVRALDEYMIGLLRARRDLHRRELREHGKVGTKRRVDILDRLLKVTGVEWYPALEQQLCYEFKTFILAGHETSAAMLCWATYECSQHPPILHRVREEAKALHLSRAPPEDTLDAQVRKGEALGYTECVLRETLRKYSVVPVVVRTAAEDTTVGEPPLPIPKGTNVCLLMQATHQLPKYWPEPDEFRPERFLAPLQDPFQFVPFIQGPRNCLGQHLSLLESRVVLAQVLAEYTVTPVPGSSVTKHPWVVPIGPRDGMWVTVQHP